MEVLRHNPNVNTFLKHDESIPADHRLDEHLAELDKDYDKAINLCESIEGTLAKVEWREDFNWTKEKRHEECNKNFYDFTLDWGGYGDIKGRNGQLHFTHFEERLAKGSLKKHSGKFVILWSLSGSSAHKTYPYSEYIAHLFLSRHRDAVILTVGDEICELIEPHGNRIKNYSGKWPIRKSLIMTKYVDLVIGPDTGLMHGAGCYDTPKILMLSSNTEENLSKHWENCTNLSAGVTCQPCHRLHYTKQTCVLDNDLKTPICMTKLSGEVVLEAMEQVYQDWKAEKVVNG